MGGAEKPPPSSSSSFLSSSGDARSGSAATMESVEAFFSFNETASSGGGQQEAINRPVTPPSRYSFSKSKTPPPPPPKDEERMINASFLLLLLPARDEFAIFLPALPGESQRRDPLDAFLSPVSIIQRIGLLGIIVSKNTNTIPRKLRKNGSFSTVLSLSSSKRWRKRAEKVLGQYAKKSQRVCLTLKSVALT